MPISFSDSPAQWRQPLYTVEVDRSVAGPGYETKSMTASFEQEDCGDYCNELRILPNSISERPLIGRDAERALCLMEHQGMTEEEAYAQVSHWAITDATNSRLIADGTVPANASAAQIRDAAMRNMSEAYNAADRMGQVYGVSRRVGETDDQLRRRIFSLIGVYGQAEVDEFNLDNPTPLKIFNFAQRVMQLRDEGLSGVVNSPRFQRALRVFQEWSGVPVDGVLGILTMQAIERAVEQRPRVVTDQEGVRNLDEQVIVERDPDDPNRLNVLYPYRPELENQLRTFAALSNFRLQYDQERRTVGPTDDRGSRTFQNLEYIRDHGLQAPMELSLFCREIEVLRSPIELHIGRTHELRSSACSTTSCLIDSWAVYPAGSAVDAVPIAAGDFDHARALTTGDSITWSMNINIDHSDHPRQRGQVGRLTAINGQDRVHGYVDEPVE